ncbi:hypothetical protein T484DRAFT_1905373, partial [Baffinella frigidus]
AADCSRRVPCAGSGRLDASRATCGAAGSRLGRRGRRGWLILSFFVALLATGALAQEKEKGSGERKGTGKAGAGDEDDDGYNGKAPFVFDKEEFPGPFTIKRLTYKLVDNTDDAQYFDQ